MFNRPHYLPILVALAATLILANGAEPAQPGMKTESFDHDPGWEAYNNRVVPKKPKTVVQDFGYSQTHYAGKASGEIGGQVWRASEPAYYADKIAFAQAFGIAAALHMRIAIQPTLHPGTSPICITFAL
jgi:hypothetical protein